MSKREIYRILDAAANRGREALRVVEDAIRFLDDNEELARKLKETRHRFAAAADKLDRGERMSARDTVGDVGTELETPDEYERATLTDVLTANFARLQESARSLEEFSKIVEPQLAKEWERVRYESYTLEKIAYEEAAKLERDEKPTAADPAENESADEKPAKDEPIQEESINEESATQEPTGNATPEPQATRPAAPEPSFDETPRESVAQGAPFARADELSPRELRKTKLRKSNLCFYVDRPLADADAETLFNSGIGIYQLRYYPGDASSSPETILFLEQIRAAYADEANALRRPLLLARDFTVWADDFDGGVLTSDNWREARAELGADRLLGAAVSTLDEALGAFQAGEEGILDFIEAGPIFSDDGISASTGLGLLRAVLEAVDEKPPIPVFAFGGIAESNVDDVCYAGIERVCVDASVMSEQDKRLGRIRFASMF